MMGIGDDHLGFVVETFRHKQREPWIAPAVFAAAITSVDAMP